jgi:phosphohistidine swiveling domain-containing protein
MLNPSEKNQRVAIVVIDASKGQRRLDASSSLPQALDRTAAASPILQWIISAATACGISDITYIGGYHIEKVIEAFPDLSFRFRSLRNEGGELAALSLIRPKPDTDYLILRANVIPLPGAFERILDANGDLVVGVNGAKKTSSAGIALIRSAKVNAIWSEIGSTKLATDFDAYLSSLEDADSVSISDVAATAQDVAAVSELVFRGKARTLAQLSRLVKSAVIPDQIKFTVEDWQQDPGGIIWRIAQFVESGLIVVRSSALAEDGLAESGAGRFHSELNVDAQDAAAVAVAVGKVVASYARADREYSPNDEVLVQRQVHDVQFSGVLLTRDPRTSAPYYVVNYEAGSGRSDIVTSGSKGDVRTVYVAHDAVRSALPTEVASVVALARELIELTFLDSLDLEFAIDAAGVLYLFQVRPLTICASGRLDEDLFGLRDQAKVYIAGMLERRLDMLGATSLLANMSDWNPAEMIGSVPRPLALSIYQKLIGSGSWSTARAAIGYREVGPEPLIHAVGGHPYVDVRASLNSFLPKDLPDAIGVRWIDDCIARLRKDPALQDKIEFQVTVTCLAPDWPIHAARMADMGLSNPEIAAFRDAMARLTQAILTTKTGSIDLQLRMLAKLDAFRCRTEAEVADGHAAARATMSLLERCVEQGVVPFAILARYGFIAMSFLRSLRSIGALELDDYDLVLRQIPTVAGEFAQDATKYRSGRLSLAEMIALYGHLRPQTYDITSLPYAQNSGVFGHGGEVTKVATQSEAINQVSAIFELRRSKIEAALKDLGLDVSIGALADFVVRAISARERAKFEFTKTVSASLELIVVFGRSFGLSRDDLSFLTLADIAHYASNSASGATARRLSRLVDYRRKRQVLTEALRLPDVLDAPSNADSFVQARGKPNFVTRKSIRAPIVFVHAEITDVDLTDKVVAIRAADPGFDWIFGARIAGLVTEYGGVASHMAIRAAEFGIPAAIGCGSKIFEELINARSVEIDGAAENVRPL